MHRRPLPTRPLLSVVSVHGCARWGGGVGGGGACRGVCVVGQTGVCAVGALLFPESRKLSENWANCTE